jgi:methionyl-tRNA formyltransferase
LRIVFMGTPAFAVPSLEALVRAGHDVRAVVSQPDRPRGRGLAPAPPPAAQAARALGLSVLQPAKVRDPAFLPQLVALAPELIAVVAFGQILPRAILDVPPLGCVNVHASLLPLHRGAAPIQWALLRGETVTGVTTMFMNERMDEGDVLRAREVAIAPDETAGSLEARLAVEGARLLVETVADLAAGRVTPRPQDPAAATLAPKLTKEDGRIRWSDPARDVVNRVRAATPRPGAFTTLEGRQLKVWQARVAADSGGAGAARPGTVLRADESGVRVAAGDGGVVSLLELQLEGRRRLPAREWIAGARLAPGAVLGSPPEVPRTAGAD